MSIVQMLVEVAVELLPSLLVLLFKSFKFPRGLQAATLGTKIATILPEINKGDVEDHSEEKIPTLDREGKVIQRLDLTQAQGGTVKLNKTKIGQISAHKYKGSLMGNGLIAVSVDFSEAEADNIDLRRAEILSLDLSKARIGTLNLSLANIFCIDLSESEIGTIIGQDQARIYIEDRWQASIKQEVRGGRRKKTRAP